MERRVFPGAEQESTAAAFSLLDNPNKQTVSDFVEHLKTFEKETWVIQQLFAHYLNTESQKAMDLLTTAHSCHDKVIWKKLHSGLEEPSQRRKSLKLLLNIVSKRPSWLHKIVDASVFNILLRVLVTDKNAQNLMDSMYVITMLLPVVPDGIVKYFDDIFSALIRLIHFTFYNKDGVANEFILHLNVGIYSLFSRLYGMYPWKFIIALQEFYMKGGNYKELYIQAIEPMLTRVKFNPLLVTATKEKESRGDQWKKKEVHDIVAYCASLTLDNTESTMDYKHRCPVLISNNHDLMIQNTLIAQDLKTSIGITSTEALQPEVSAPIELSKDSLVSTIVNSTTFYSPSVRLGLSTPPVGPEPDTPSAASANSNPFSFVTPTRSTPQHVLASIKTPQNTNHNTPTQYTPKDTPTTPFEDSGVMPRSRHTSGNKGSLSRLSYDEAVPPSPLRKEFTSEPPIDVHRVSFVAPEAKAATLPHTTGPRDILSVNNLPHLLEKISDAGSFHDSDITNNSDDEEVSSINQLQMDIPTSKSVMEFMKNVNRIRFNSMTVVETEKTTKRSRRPDSCPTFTEEHTDSVPEKKAIERASSIQTSAADVSLELVSTAAAVALLEPKRSLECVVSIPTCNTDTHVTQSANDVCLTSLKEQPACYYGPGSILDTNLYLLKDDIRLASNIHKQILNSSKHSAVNWTHFGDSVSDVSIVNGQLALLHTQLLYERQKRELHAERNRRLLSKIAKAEKHREENSILEDKLKRLQTDIFNLQTTYRLQTEEIKRLKDDKSKNDAKRENELTSLVTENERLKFRKDELERQLVARQEEVDDRTKTLAQTVGRNDALEQELQVASQKINQFKGYEDEVSRLKRDLLLMGEIQVKYEDKLDALKYDNQMTLSPQQEEHFINEISNLQSSIEQSTRALQSKQVVLDALNCKINEKDTVIKEYKEKLQVLQGEHRCNLQALEEKYKMSQSAVQALENQQMMLYDQIGRLTAAQLRKSASAATSSTTNTSCSSPTPTHSSEENMSA